MLRVKIALFVLFAQFAIFETTVAADETMFTPEQQRAVLVAENVKYEIQEQFSYCTSFLGDKAPYFRFSEYFWLNDYLPLKFVASNVLPTIPSSEKQNSARIRDLQSQEFRLKFGRAANDQKSSMCMGLVAKAMQNSLDFSSSYPIEAAILRPLYEGNENYRIRKRDADLLSGCMKRVWNLGGRDFEKAHSACDCQTKAITDHATSEELDEWISRPPAAEGEGVKSLLNKPWFQEALKDLAVCYQSN